MNKSSELLQLKTIKTKRRPVLTIGICVRNSEATIEEAIDSILIQDFPHELIEVIFVDDGSTDKTLSIIENYVPRMNMHVKVFHHEWKGLGASRNVVINNANGDYIVWVDGDMILAMDYISKQLEFMEQHPKAGIAKGTQSLEPCENLLATLESYSRAASRMVDYNSERGRLKAIGTGGSIYRSEAIQRAGGFDENLRGYGEDWDAEIRVKAAGWLMCITSVEFRDFERRKLSLKLLWSRYWLRGYHQHFFLNKNKGLIRLYKMSPPATFISGFLYALTIYRLTHQKKAFLLPFQCFFKAVAWYAGFSKARVDYHRLVAIR
jgi:glycosyltransferase involved in cell wall biosynthesis